MIQIILFVKGEYKDRMMRKIVPRIGESIVIDCGEMVRVVEVSHQWNVNDTNFVQVDTTEIELKEN